MAAAISQRLRLPLGNPYATFEPAIVYSESPFLRGASDFSPCPATWSAASPTLAPDPSVSGRAEKTSVEVQVLWGGNLLSVQHLTPPRSYYLGEPEARGPKCDFVLPAEKIGRDRVPLILADDDAVRIVLLPGARGRIEVARGVMSLEKAIQCGFAEPCPLVSGGHQVTLVPDMRAVVEVNGFLFRVASSRAVTSVGADLFSIRDPLRAICHALSVSAHVGLLAAMATFAPPSGLTTSEEAAREQVDAIRHYLASIDEREQNERSSEQQKASEPERPERGSAIAALGPLDESEVASSGSAGVSHEPERQAQTPASREREAALREAATFGIIAVLSAGSRAERSPSERWKVHESVDIDEDSSPDVAEADTDEEEDAAEPRTGADLWVSSTGDSFGSVGPRGGPGLSSAGQGSGGPGEGIGLGAIGSLGQGTSRSYLPPRSEHTAHAPSLRTDDSNAAGRLPPDAIQRIVRQNFGRFRACYEAGLRRTPSLHGRVSVRFVIGRDGTVTAASNASETDLADPAVVACVVRSYYGLSFPEPIGGVVTVTYPILFTRDGESIP